MSQFLLKAAEKGDAKKVKDYLDAGVDVNWRHKHNGRTALIEAAINGHEEVARLLLDRGADLNCQDMRSERRRWDGQVNADISLWRKCFLKRVPIRITPPRNSTTLR